MSVISAMAQGTVNFNNNIPGVVVSHVYFGYGPAKYGEGPNDTPAGPQDYSGCELVEGDSWSAQLWAGNPGQTVDSLSPFDGSTGTSGLRSALRRLYF